MDSPQTHKNNRAAVLVADTHLRNHIDLFDYLRMRGFPAHWAMSEQDLRTQLVEQPAASVLLDLDLPKGGGIEWAKRIRQEFGYRTGIIMMTSSSTLEDRIKGWENGADAYLQRPVNLSELEVILKHIENRLLITNSSNNDSSSVSGAWELDLITTELITPDQKRVRLTGTEANLLSLMADNAGQSVARETLCRLLPPGSPHDDTRRLDALLSRLRRKIRATKTAHQLPLKTYRNQGYALTATLESAPPRR